MTLVAEGYSLTPLASRPSLKDRQSVVFVCLPDQPDELTSVHDFASKRLTGWQGLVEDNEGYDAVRACIWHHVNLDRNAETFKKMIALNGTVSISWSKKISKIATNVTKDVIRDGRYQWLGERKSYVPWIPCGVG